MCCAGVLPCNRMCCGLPDNYTCNVSLDYRSCAYHRCFLHGDMYVGSHDLLYSCGNDVAACMIVKKMICDRQEVAVSTTCFLGVGGGL